MSLAARWTLGLFVSLAVGCLVVDLALRGLQKLLPTPPSTTLGIPPWLTGIIERVFFTLIVAFDISGTATAMMAWIGIKMAAGWNVHQPRAATIFTALGGLMSMLFALAGGVICRPPR